MVVKVQERAERFTEQINEMKIDDPAPGRHTLWLRVGVALMVVGLGCCVVAIIQSKGTTDPLVQRDAQTLGLAGIAACIVGTGMYLRYAVTKVLRFWLARVSFELQARTDNKEIEL